MDERREDVLMDIFASINTVMAAVGPIGKDSMNTMQKFKFRGIDAIINALSPEMQKVGLVTVPTVLSSTHEILEVGSNQTKMMFVHLRVQYSIMALDGSMITSVVEGESMDTGDKATAKAMSVAWRTMLIQVFALATGEPDADEETHTVAQSKPRASTPSQFIPDDEPPFDPWSTTPSKSKHHCIHGERKEWTSAKGDVMWFCPLPKGDPDKCATEYPE